MESGKPVTRLNFALTIGLGLGFFLFLLLPFFHLIRSPFDPAELENLQASWLVHQGLIPYRDFFEHHSPLFFYLASLQFFFAHVESDPSAAIRLIFANRTTFWILSLATVTGAAFLGLLWKNKNTAFYSGIFLLSTAMFYRSGTEIHPEALAGFLWMICSLTLFLALVKGHNLHLRQMWTILAGILYGLVILTTQEMLWMLPWLILLLLMPVLRTHRLTIPKIGLLSLLLFLIGFGSIIIPSIAYFSAMNSLHPFLTQFINEYNYRISPVRNLLYLSLQQPALVLFPVIALISQAKGWISHKRIARSHRFFLILTIGMTISLLLFPAPHQQYFVFILPLLSLVAAAAISRIAETGSIWLKTKRIPFTPEAIQKAICLATLVPGLLISGFMQFTLPKTPQPQLAVIAYVIQNTKPKDIILDGRTGAFLFRPIPWYYWIQHTQVREIIPLEAVDRLLQNLEDGEVSPRFVNLDTDLRGLSPKLTEYLLTKYQPVGIGDLREIIPD